VASQARGKHVLTKAKGLDSKSHVKFEGVEGLTRDETCDFGQIERVVKGALKSKKSVRRPIKPVVLLGEWLIPSCSSEGDQSVAGHTDLLKPCIPPHIANMTVSEKPSQNLPLQQDLQPDHSVVSNPSLSEKFQAVSATSLAAIKHTQVSQEDHVSLSALVCESPAQAALQNEGVGKLQPCKQALYLDNLAVKGLTPTPDSNINHRCCFSSPSGLTPARHGLPVYPEGDKGGRGSLVSVGSTEILELSNQVSEMKALLAESRQSRCTFKLRPPVPFSGLTSDDFLYFKSKFINFCDNNRMSQDMRLLYLPQMLEGSAFQWFQNMESAKKVTCDSVFNELNEIFGPKSRRAQLFRELFRTNQTSTQSVHEFAHEIQKRMQNLDIRDDQQKLYQFVTGLLPELQKVVVLKNPNSLQEAISYAALAESTIDAPLLNPELNELKSMIYAITNAAPPSTNNRIGQLPPQPKQHYNHNQCVPPSPAVAAWRFCRRCSIRHEWGCHIVPPKHQSNPPSQTIKQPPVSFPQYSGTCSYMYNNGVDRRTFKMGPFSPNCNMIAC
jgi:hypothetical protein